MASDRSNPPGFEGVAKPLPCNSNPRIYAAAQSRHVNTETNPIDPIPSPLNVLTAIANEAAKRGGEVLEDRAASSLLKRAK